MTLKNYGGISPLTVIQDDDRDPWVALVRRPITLPVSLCEITATLVDSTVLALMGKGDVWTTETGARVPVDLITSFEVNT